MGKKTEIVMIEIFLLLIVDLHKLVRFRIVLSKIFN